MAESLETLMQLATDRQGVADYLIPKEDELSGSLFERILTEAGDHYESFIAIVTGLPDHLRNEYMKTEARRYLLEQCLKGEVSLQTTLDLLSFERGNDTEFDLEVMTHYIESAERFNQLRREATEATEG